MLAEQSTRPPQRVTEDAEYCLNKALSVTARPVSRSLALWSYSLHHAFLVSPIESRRHSRENRRTRHDSLRAAGAIFAVPTLTANRSDGNPRASAFGGPRLYMTSLVNVSWDRTCLVLYEARIASRQKTPLSYQSAFWPNHSTQFLVGAGPCGPAADLAVDSLAARPACIRRMHDRGRLQVCWGSRGRQTTRRNFSPFSLGLCRPCFALPSGQLRIVCENMQVRAPTVSLWLVSSLPHLC